MNIYLFQYLYLLTFMSVNITGRCVIEVTQRNVFFRTLIKVITLKNRLLVEITRSVLSMSVYSHLRTKVNRNCSFNKVN